MKNVLNTLTLVMAMLVLFAASPVQAGVKMKVTAYNNVRGQTDRTPNIPACGRTVYDYSLPQLAVNPRDRRKLGIKKCFAEVLVNGEKHIVTDVKGNGGLDKLILCPKKGSCGPAISAARRFGNGKGHIIANIEVLSVGKDQGRGYKKVKKKKKSSL